MEYDNVSFIEAVKMLAKRAGISLPTDSQRDRRKATEIDKIYAANKFAADYYHRLLTETDQGIHARKYLSNRKLNQETTRIFKLGVAPDSWDSLLKNAAQTGLSEEILEKAGLIKKRKDDRGYYDYFRNRLIFPIFNTSGRVIGFGGRTFSDDVPKYLNTPETRTYHKSKSLYGLYQCKNSIRRNQKALIVEGYVDVLSLYQNGIDYAVASLGTSFTEHQANLISRYSKHCVLLYDSDSAGVSATSRGIDILIGAGLEVGIVTLPSGQDPDDFVKAQRKDGVEDALEKEKDFLEYMIQHADMTTTDRKTAAIKDILHTISKISDDIRKSLYLRRLSEEFGIDEQRLRNYLMREKSNDNFSGSTQKNRSREKMPAHEEQLLGLMLNSPDALEIISQELVLDDFKTPIAQKLADIILNFSKDHELNPNHLIDSIEEPEIKGLISQLMLKREMYENFNTWLEDKILFLKRKRIQAQLSQIKSQLKNTTDNSEMMLLMERYSELANKLN
jgi:DNA primase